MPEPLATETDVQARLGRPLSPDESARVGALLTDASAEVRGYTGQHLSRTTSTVDLPVTHGRVWLPQRPVVEVTAVDDMSGPFDVEGGQLHIGGWGSVTVTYTHGYEPVPDDVVAIVCAMVIRNLAPPAVGPAMSSETIGDYSYRMAASAIARRPVIDSTDKATLDRYRLPDLGAVWLVP